MPRVKIDYVVSMSSEDPENPANNLLSWDVSKKKWLCTMGETSCSVVLQLAKAIQIESISIGTFHTALLEVLVGSSEKPNETFEVLVPSCVICTPREARGAPLERVKSFTRDALTDARQRRWDRLRLVCSQPYNRHCKYGLSFVHIFEPERSESRTLLVDALCSDDEDLRPGELFMKHEQDKKRFGNADAQIRHATSLALNDISDSAAKLIKTPVTQTSITQRLQKNSSCPRREKRSLIHTEDDERPHERIDRVVRRHNEQKQKEDDVKKKTSDVRQIKKKTADEGEKKDRRKENNKQTDNRTNKNTASSCSKKRKRSDEGPGSPCPLSSLLSEVVFSISGYVNPRRATVRAAALQMGARYTPHVTNDCTHLICAFPNTPKLRAVGPGVAVVRADWLEDCLRTGARLNTSTYDTRRAAAGSGARGEDADDDTDDDIEEALLDNERTRGSCEGSGGSGAGGEDDTDEEDGAQRTEEIDEDKSLPTFLEGVTFRVSEDLGTSQRGLLERYITAYGGVVLQSPRCEPPHYSISSTAGSGPSWLWECHARRELLPQHAPPHH